MQVPPKAVGISTELYPCNLFSRFFWKLQLVFTYLLDGIKPGVERSGEKHTGSGHGCLGRVAASGGTRVQAHVFTGITGKWLPVIWQELSPGARDLSTLQVSPPVTAEGISVGFYLPFTLQSAAWITLVQLLINSDHVAQLI